MSFRTISNFADRTDGLDPSVNVYVNRILEKDTTQLPVFHGEELRELRGNYREKMAEHFGRQANKRLVLEIGCRGLPEC